MTRNMTMILRLLRSDRSQAREGDLCSLSNTSGGAFVADNFQKRFGETWFCAACIVVRASIRPAHRAPRADSLRLSQFGGCFGIDDRSLGGINSSTSNQFFDRTDSGVLNLFGASFSRDSQCICR